MERSELMKIIRGLGYECQVVDGVVETYIYTSSKDEYNKAKNKIHKVILKSGYNSSFGFVRKNPDVYTGKSDMLLQV